MTKPLKLYRASAGSGKTFTLAVEYIKLLIENTDEYKYILAVTFTNKATAEMKNRILGKLYGLANSLKDSDDYLKAIKEDDTIKELHLSDDEIRRRCGTALHKIIHDYSRFHIETIDSFFQSVIRDLSRELDLTANLRVDLNSEEVLQEAVNTIIDELTPQQEVFKTILAFVKEKIEEGKNWKINEEVSSFGKNIFREEYLKRREIITSQTKDAKLVRKYKADILRFKEQALEQLKTYGNGFAAQMSNLDLSYNQIKYGNNLETFVNKLTNGIIPEVSQRLKDWCGDPSSMVKDKKVNNVIVFELAPLLQKVVGEIAKITKTVNTVDAICKHLNHLMLLNIINEKVRMLNSDANRFLLADSAHFLNEIIDGSDIPFIYEKAGNKFKHIMIDEFQDTSALQWENFKPLIYNSMSMDQTCLIVGDVKQSIYRWRDSDWQILNQRIDQEFSRYINPIPLDRNFRSAGNVIHFNNQFYTQAVKLINEDYEKKYKEDSQDLNKAYSDVRQKVKDKNEGRGYVYVSNYVGEGYEDADNMPRRILDTVKELHAQGIEWNDMTILVRENRAIPTLCQYFNEHSDEIDTKIVSDQAFRLDSSSAITLIILALTAIKNPNDSFAIRNFAIHYQMVRKSDISLKNDANRFFLCPDEELEELLPEGFLDKIKKYAFTPLYELIEDLYAVLDLDKIKGQDAYLFYFHDQVNNYVQDNQTDIDLFLSYWEEKMCALTIPNGASNGIRIMSIHKSKGLEFHTVIIPYCDWSTTGKSSDLMWCETVQEPYNDLDVVPINYSSSLENSIFQSDYREEVLRNNVDNLNLIYVAFTRASENLIILTGSKPKKASALNNIQQIIVGSMQKLMRHTTADYVVSEKPIELQEENDNDLTIWTYGSPVASKEKEEEKSENILEKKYSDVDTVFVHEEANIDFRQSNESNRLIMNDEEDETQSDDYIQKGLIYHQIFELIRTKDDVDKVINELDGRGYFNSVLSVDEARSNIKEALEDPRAGRWFEEGWQEFKECTIMYKDKYGKMKEKRPDRVIIKDNETIVIDYKSGQENPNHKKQVSWYMTLLKRMGYKNIKGYVWYFMQNKIDEAKIEKGGSK